MYILVLLSYLTINTACGGLVAQSCPTLCDHMNCSLSGSSIHGIHTGVDCHFLLQRIFLTQGSNPSLLHCRQILYHLSYREDLKYCIKNVCFFFPGTSLVVQWLRAHAPSAGGPGFGHWSGN